MDDKPIWEIAFVLPNLKLGERDLQSKGLTLGLDGIAIVPTSDERVRVIRGWSKAADRFLGAFHTGLGKPVNPAVLIVRDDWMAQFNRNVEPVISFRNAVALSAVLPCRARGPSESWTGSSWTDTFDYHPAVLRPDGSSFYLLTPALDSYKYALVGLSITPDQRLPLNNLGLVDEPLAIRLGRAWSRRYLRARERRMTARIFRSLDTAYHAASIGFKNYSSLNEVGMDTVYWTNAIEILAAPDCNEVTKWDCSRLIGDFNGSYPPALRNRKYRVRKRRKAGKPNEIMPVNFAQKIFFCLYRARSKFVHGDSVSAKLLRPFGPDTPSLLSLASTVYRLALYTYLERHWPWRPTLRDPNSFGLLLCDPYEKHLLEAAGVGDKSW